MKLKKNPEPAMLDWGSEERERLTLVLSWLKKYQKAADAPAGLAELAGIAAAAKRLYDEVNNGTWANLKGEAKAELFEAVFGMLRENRYRVSILNPDVARKAYGSTYAQVISALGVELQETVPYLMRGIRKPFLYVCELIAEIFGHIEKDGVDRGIKQSLYYYVHDYCREYAQLRIYDRCDLRASRETEAVIRRAAVDEASLYDYGLPVSEEVLGVHRYLAKQSEETVDNMARTYVNGFLDSFVTMRIDPSGKRTVALDTFFGFERVTARAMELFREAGLEPLVYLQSRLLANIITFQHSGMAGNALNRQAMYDHRNNWVLTLQRPMLEESVTALSEAMEPRRSELATFAGPAVQEIFGTPEVEFVNKRAVPAVKGRTAGYIAELQQRVMTVLTGYIKPEERTFTIIAYPVPSIGERFEDVFRETIRCNTLSNARYKEIQQKLIDLLDRGAYVTVTGRGSNETDMRVMLHELRDPSAQTNFENCGADVNIPVGEVFTSPVLKGTEGTLHVSNVCINGISYKNLRLCFRDGMITSYSCENFKTESENKAFLNETILMHHETLPIGEFAIGTNTVAYAMGIRYGVQEKLPILIAEKTGPHFAVGDTCYSHAEEHALYNPDGKEIIARENEVSALRSTDPAKAYMNCHTDITLPYDELGEITVHAADGTPLGTILRDGRFTVPGTEELNAPLESLARDGYISL